MRGIYTAINPHRSCAQPQKKTTGEFLARPTQAFPVAEGNSGLIGSTPEALANPKHMLAVRNCEAHT